MELQIDVLALVVTTLIGLVVTGLYAQMRSFIKEQREVNAANANANKSLQRDVLFRYFEKAVERREPITPEELEHVTRCWEAYKANGGNGAGKVMFERIQEHAIIDTGRS